MGPVLLGVSRATDPIQNKKGFFMFLALLPAPFVTWSIAASTVAAMFVRPRRIPEAIWACLGTGLLLAFHLVPFPEALGAVTKGYDVYLFLTGMMVLAELGRREGVFEWLAGIAIRAAAGSRARLFALIYLLGIVVTTVLSNDATAVVLTPAVYAVMKRAKGDPLPYLFACAFIAIAGVLLYCSATGKSLGLPTCITAFAITLFITPWDRQAPLALGRGVSWSVLPLVAGLFVIVEALDSAGGLQLARNLLDKLTEWPPLIANLATAFGFAVTSNLINNLPLGLIGASALHASAASGHLANAMLMGIDIGPNLSVATILWLIALRRENLQVSAWSFLKVGMIVMPLALLLAGLFLGLTSPQKEHYPGESKRSATNLCQISPKEFRQIIPKESPNAAYAINQ
jgi:Na+/H+ antiporter NhaD/arsenite permease-like protein